MSYDHYITNEEMVIEIKRWRESVRRIDRVTAAFRRQRDVELLAEGHIQEIPDVEQFNEETSNFAYGDDLSCDGDDVAQSEQSAVAAVQQVKENVFEEETFIPVLPVHQTEQPEDCTLKSELTVAVCTTESDAVSPDVVEVVPVKRESCKRKKKEEVEVLEDVSQAAQRHSAATGSSKRARSISLNALSQQLVQCRSDLQSGAVEQQVSALDFLCNLHHGISDLGYPRLVEVVSSGVAVELVAFVTASSADSAKGAQSRGTQEVNCKAAAELAAMVLHSDTSCRRNLVNTGAIPSLLSAMVAAASTEDLGNSYVSLCLSALAKLASGKQCCASMFEWRVRGAGLVDILSTKVDSSADSDADLQWVAQIITSCCRHQLPTPPLLPLVKGLVARMGIDRNGKQAQRFACTALQILLEAEDQTLLREAFDCGLLTTLRQLFPRHSQRGSALRNKLLWLLTHLSASEDTQCQRALVSGGEQSHLAHVLNVLNNCIGAAATAEQTSRDLDRATDDYLRGGLAFLCNVLFSGVADQTVGRTVLESTAINHLLALVARAAQLSAEVAASLVQALHNYTTVATNATHMRPLFDNAMALGQLLSQVTARCASQTGPRSCEQVLLHVLRLVQNMSLHARTATAETTQLKMMLRGSKIADVVNTLITSRLVSILIQEEAQKIEMN